MGAIGVERRLHKAQLLRGDEQLAGLAELLDCWQEGWRWRMAGQRGRLKGAHMHISCTAAGNLSRAPMARGHLDARSLTALQRVRAATCKHALELHRRMGGCCCALQLLRMRGQPVQGTADTCVLRYSCT